MGNAPDFVITSVTGPTSVQDGQPLTAQVTVCNQGTTSGDAQVELYLSADATIRTNSGPGPMEDSIVGGAPSGWLFQGQCATVPIQGPAWLPPPGLQGAYHLGAIVDPSNNRQELIFFLRPTVLTNTPAIDNAETMRRLDQLPTRDAIKEELHPGSTPPPPRSVLDKILPK